MSAFIYLFNRGVAPFLTGALMAGAAMVDMTASVPLMLAAIGTGYLSLPAGEELMRRLLGAFSEG